MRTRLLLVAGALLSAGCGGGDQPDAYKGFIDGSALDAKFLPGKCGSTPCYPSQGGFVQGKPVAFYNLGSIATTALTPALKSAALAPVFDFPPGQRCRAPQLADPPSPPYDALRDAYDATQQLPLFSALPLAAKVGVLVMPFVNVAPIVSNRLFTCNDVKDASAVAWNGSSPGKYNLTADTVAEVRMRAVLDPTAPLAPATGSGLTLTTSLGWYKDLLLTYLDGGAVPLNSAGELQAMDGVILDPAGVTTFAKPTDANVVLLPFSRGQEGYSPIVRLHSWRLPAGKLPGDFTGLCNGTGCGPKDVNFTQAAASAFNTIFIVSQ